tara:strand:+ start:693 stop:1502 length:810 start_codon:yes stop_codon:yes gene_type:complete
MALWTPSNLSATLTAWQQGGSTVGVRTWQDSSGNDNDLIQATSGDQPSTTTLNGLTILDFTSSENDHMDYGDLNDMDVGTGNFYVVIVFNPDTLSANQALLAKHSGADDYLFRTTSSGTLQQYIGSTSSGVATTSALLSTGTNFIACGFRRLDTQFIRLDGAQVKSTGNTNSLSNSNTFHVAGQASAGTAANFDGKIAEIILGGGFISDEELEQIEGYLAERYALTSLPATHPYKQHPPTESLEISGTSGDIEGGLTLSVSSELTTVRI